MESILDSPCIDPTDSLPDKKGNTKPQYSSMYGEAKELQTLVLNDARKKNIKPFVRAQLVRAYRELAELRLRLQGKGPPKAVDYASRKPKKQASQGFTETASEAKPAPKKPDATKQDG